jgi:alpha-mannosidase
MSSKTVIVTFNNHFDLIWRRGWERDYVYEGGCYASYAWVEEQVMLRNLDLAERNEGAHVVEQTLSLRMLFRRHPDAIARVKSMIAAGRFDVLGAGESIMDVNLCSFETMARNLASGKRYCRDVLGVEPLLAYHGDGFGSSAQFPQVIRKCGYRGVTGLSYSLPDNRYWRGLDGSVVLCAGYPGGRAYWFDHDYHEPCRVCRGFKKESCAVCKGTGFDLPQNVYPPFEPISPADIRGDVATYVVASEEMLPPEELAALLRKWETEQPDIRYRFGVPRELAAHWEPLAESVDHPPADQIASRVENNPVQTGCYVSRIRIKQEARRLESTFYGWEKAALTTARSALDRGQWEELFLELPLVFFHDGITGTHQDEAFWELMDRMAACATGIERTALAAIAPPGMMISAAKTAIAGIPLAIFNPNGHRAPIRAPLSGLDWRKGRSLVATTKDGKRFPVVWPLHGFSPAMPVRCERLVDATGPTARTRPDNINAVIEAGGLQPLAWTAVTLEAGNDPMPDNSRALDNGTMKLELGEHGVRSITDKASGDMIHADDWSIGELIVEEDEGDPWGTRKIPSFRRAMGPYSRFLGTLRFDGYQESYYAGRYESNLVFAKEEDPKIFPLDWYITFRLLDGVRRVDVQFEIYWKSVDRRLRAVFPVQASTDRGIYSIPGGWLQRDRYDQKQTWLFSPNGDWPALYFHGSLPGRGRPGWALINYGTPSARIEDGRLMASLIRSPGFGHCLERYAQDYPMPTSGMRDGGWRLFTFSLMPYENESSFSNLSLTATALNQVPPVVSSPAGSLPDQAPFTVTGKGVEVVAIKPSFDHRDKDSVVIRLLNHGAERTSADIIFKSWLPSTVAEVDLMEDRVSGLKIERDTLHLELGAFECKSMKLSFDATKA